MKSLWRSRSSLSTSRPAAARKKRSNLATPITGNSGRPPHPSLWSASRLCCPPVPSVTLRLARGSRAPRFTATIAARPAGNTEREMADREDAEGALPAKRDPRRTPEPRGAPRPRRGRRGQPIFVIQKHDASSLHYDFRLEADGVLKSWAVPKGPSTNPRDKRLAMPTEDHPMDYADFEGVIPEGEYGAGTVLVWDTGTWRNLTEKDGEQVPVEQALQDGHLRFELQGSKLTGPYALTRVGRGGRERWLLVKMAGEGADARRKPVRSQPDSVLSGRGLEEIAAEAGDQGSSR